MIKHTKDEAKRKAKNIVSRIRPLIGNYGVGYTLYDSDDDDNFPQPHYRVYICLNPKTMKRDRQTVDDWLANAGEDPLEFRKPNTGIIRFFVEEDTMPEYKSMIGITPSEARTLVLFLMKPSTHVQHADLITRLKKIADR